MKQFISSREINCYIFKDTRFDILRLTIHQQTSDFNLSIKNLSAFLS